jgi:hypothetical protein
MESLTNSAIFLYIINNNLFITNTKKKRRLTFNYYYCFFFKEKVKRNKKKKKKKGNLKNFIRNDNIKKLMSLKHHPDLLISPLWRAWPINHKKNSINLATVQSPRNHEGIFNSLYNVTS